MEHAVSTLRNYRDCSGRLTELPVLVGEDNPAFDGLFEFCSISAGGSIGASSVYGTS